MKHSSYLNELIARAETKARSSDYFADKLQLAELRRLVDLVSALENLAANPSPKSTPEAHKLMIAKKAEELAQARAKASDTLYARLGNTYSDLVPKAKEQAGIKSSPYEAEIRNTFKSMSKAEKSEAIREAINNKQGEIINAISEAPELITGFSQQETKKIYEDYLERHAPSTIQQIRNSESLVMDEGTNILKGVQRAVNEGFDPEEIRKINEKEELHRASFEEFEKAKNG